MKQTTNYKFNKPELTDLPDITQLNQNFDTIDAELKAHDTEIEALDAALDGKAASSHSHAIGDLPLASVEEAKAGSIDTKVMTPAKAKESALAFGMAIKGTNPITSTSNDTPVKWGQLGAGTYYFTQTGCLIDQPNQYGFLINHNNGSEVFQLFKKQNSGSMYYRSGNASGWGETWTKCANNNDLGAYLPLAGGDMTGTVTFGDHSIFTNSNGDLLIGDYDNGALLRVRSNASDDNSGGFQFRAEHEGVNHFFIGKPGGKLTWGGKNIVRSVNGVFADDAGNVANNQFKSKATNIITSVSDDTQAKWATIEAGVYWFTQSGCVNDQPSQYGFLIHYTSGGEIFQLWRENPSGAMWYRGANPTGGWNNTTWKKLADDASLASKIAESNGTFVLENSAGVALDSVTVPYVKSLTISGNTITFNKADWSTGTITIPTGAGAKAYITETWVSGASWYRKWSDGWIEQGGRLTTTTNRQTITLHQAFNNTNYIVLHTLRNATASGSLQPFTESVQSMKTTSFTLYCDSATLSRMWYACGY